MSNTTTDPNTGILVPTPGQDPGPDYATNVSNALTKLSSLTHTGASNQDGIQIPSDGLNINADLSAQSHNLVGLRSTRYVSQSNPLAGAGDVDCVYFLNGDAWINNGAGTPIQLTSGSSTISLAGNSYSTANVNTNRTIVSTDVVVVLNVDAVAAPIVITLPLVSSVGVGRFYLIKDSTGHSQAHPITINPLGSDKFDGASSLVIADNFSAVGLVSTGSGDWMVFQYDKKVYTGAALALNTGSSLTIDGTSNLTVDGITTVGVFEATGASLFDGNVEIDGVLTTTDGISNTGGITSVGGLSTDTVNSSGSATLNSVTVPTTLGVTGVCTLHAVGCTTLSAGGLVSCAAGLDVVGAPLNVGTILSPVASNLTGLVTCGPINSGAINASGDITLQTGGTGFKFATPRTYTRTFTFTGSGFDDSGTISAAMGISTWQFMGLSPVQINVNAGPLLPYVFTVMHVPQGATIVNLTTFLVGGNGHAGSFPTGVTQPVMQLIQTKSTTSGSSVLGSWADTSPKSVYESFHGLGSGSISFTVDNQNHAYLVTISAETGSNAEVGLTIIGLQVQYTASQIDDGGN